MKKLSLQSRILLGRLLTRSGDQAWDFAIPIVLLKLFPDQLRIVALYFFLAKLLNVFLIPKMASLIDRIDRLMAARIGMLLQLVGVIIGIGAIFSLTLLNKTAWYWSATLPLIIFTFLILGGVLSGLGSAFMDIAIANDLVPSSLEADELSKFNSRMRQTDLFTEVTAPVVAGFILLIDQPPLLGFYLIALWNVLSFIPELGLIQSILKDRPDLLHKIPTVTDQTRKSLLLKLTDGWRSFLREPVALVVIAYSFLWLSVLSPHGVLLSGFLKDGWRLPEWVIGTFRGAGAFFGLIATVIFPWVENKWGLLRGTKSFIIYQTIMLVIALGFFFADGMLGQAGFLIFILFSRVGLYGFSLGEMQIRQVGIAPSVRGEVNGFANALTGIATLGLYAAGALLPTTDDFRLLIVGSVVMVGLGCITYLVWLRKNGSQFLNNNT